MKDAWKVLDDLAGESKMEELGELVAVPGEVFSRGAAFIRIYMENLQHGESFARMLATQDPPGCKTDREFFSGMGTLADQFSGDEKVMKQTIASAKRNGYTPGTNDVYVSGLADFVGDPKAFVPATGGRSHIKKVLEAKGYDTSHKLPSNGLVSAVPRQAREEPKAIRMAPDIIKAKACEMVKANPDLRYKTKAELSAMVVEKHGKKK